MFVEELTGAEAARATSAKVRMDIRMESTLEAVEMADGLIKEAARVARFRASDQERIQLAVHETLVNAVIHGNRADRERRVHLVLSQDSDSFIIDVEDEGDGLPSADHVIPEDEDLFRSSGRGMLIMRAYVDEVAVVSKPGKGTRVRLAKRLPV